MSSIDRHALHESNKVLGIFFIITISISSLYLLIKLYRRLRQNFMDIPKAMFFSMTCGTLLFSLFYLVVSVRKAFHQDVRCQSSVLAAVYGQSYFPFVYATAFIAIAFEWCVAKKGYTFLQPIAVRVAYIVSPWIVGCIVALPLTLSGVDVSSCRNNYYDLSRQRAIIWICNLLPIFAIGAMCILVYVVKTGSGTNDVTGKATSHSVSPHQRTGQVSYQEGYNTLPSSGEGMVFTPVVPHHPPQEMAPQYQPQVQNSQQQQAQNLNVDNKQQQQQQQLQQQLQQQQYPAIQQPSYPSQAPPYNQSPMFVSIVPHTHPQYYQAMQSNMPQYQHPDKQQGIMTAHPTPNSASNVRNFLDELNTLTRAELCFISFGLGHAIFQLAYILNEESATMDPVVEIGLSMGFSWTNILKWLLINLSLIWHIK